MAEEWMEKVFEVQRASNRIILVKLLVGQCVVTFLSMYAPQSGLSDEIKDLFFDQLRAVTAKNPASEFLIPCGGIVVEMIQAAGDMGASMIRDLAAAIIRDGKVPSDRDQFGFVPCRGTTDTIFVVRQLQEKYLAANKRLYMAFIDLEKAFDRVPKKVIWWALRKLGVEELIVRMVQGMYANAQSRVRVGEGYSEEFEVKVGVHQGSVLSPLLFIIVLEALSREFRSGFPWEDLYADDLVIIAESLEECVRRLLT